jgi:DNA-binding MurR/RpiR family transcriptional regulator
MARLRAQAPSLGGAERAVAQVILDRAEDIIELSSAQVAQLAGVSRPTVVRTCQSLGLTGYQQLRVLLAREGVSNAPRERASAEHAAGDTDQGALRTVRSTFRHVADSVDSMLALLDGDTVSAAVELLAGAKRLVAVGHGVSAPLATDAASRLTAVGRVTERYSDVIGERIAVAGLASADAVLIVSGSGSSRPALDAARSARDAGAKVLVLTAFSHAPLVDLADLSLVTGMPETSFREEIVVTTRIPQTILLEGLLTATAERLGEAGRIAKERSMDTVSAYVEE